MGIVKLYEKYFSNSLGTSIGGRKNLDGSSGIEMFHIALQLKAFFLKAILLLPRAAFQTLKTSRFWMPLEPYQPEDCHRPDSATHCL